MGKYEGWDGVSRSNIEAAIPHGNSPANPTEL